MARTLTRRRSAEAPPARTYKAVADVDVDPENTDDNAAPTRGRRQTLHTDAPKVTKPEVKKGWDAADDAKSDDFPDEFKIDDEASLIKFVENEPFAVYKQHWIERTGKRSWRCLEDDCPLCDEVGDRPSAKIGFNIIDLADPAKPVNKIWLVGSRVATNLKNLNKDKKTGPIDRDDLYYAVSRSGTKSKSVTSIIPVKARDLEEWDVEALTSEELDDFFGQAYDSDVVEFHTKKQLAEIADELLGS